jgi:hypothetical protein
LSHFAPVWRASGEGDRKLKRAIAKILDRIVAAADAATNLERLFFGREENLNPPTSVLRRHNLEMTMYAVTRFSMIHVAAAFVLTTSIAAAQTQPLKGSRSPAPNGPSIKAPKANVNGEEKLPDLIVSEFKQVGIPEYDGAGLLVPVKVRFTNQGAADAKLCGFVVRYISGDFAQTPSEGKFTKPGMFWKADASYSTVPALTAGKSILLYGKISIHDPQQKLSGSKVYVRVFVDGQTSDTPVAAWVNVKESNEMNNWSSAISFTAPK